jgi:PDZ domain
MRSHLFPLFCVGAACAVAGSLISSVAAVALAPDVPLALSEGEARVEGSPALDAEKFARLLKLERRPAVPAPPAPPDFRLRGTLAPMFASVEPTAGGPTHSVFAGDALGDTTVEEIGHGFLTLRTHSGLIRLAMHAQPSAGGAPPPAQTVSLSKQELATARSQLPLIASQLRIVPAFSAGAAVGFRIAWMAPDALALKAGLRQGDVITAVNGHSLTSTDAILALAHEAQTGTSFTADILRGGSPLRLEVKSL